MPITATEKNFDTDSNLNEAQEFVDATSLSEEEKETEARDGAHSPEDDVPPVERKIRRSERILNKLKSSYNFCAVEFMSNDPSTVKEALSSPHTELWGIQRKKSMIRLC